MKKKNFFYLNFFSTQRKKRILFKQFFFLGSKEDRETQYDATLLWQFDAFLIFGMHNDTRAALVSGYCQEAESF